MRRKLYVYLCTVLHSSVITTCLPGCQSARQGSQLHRIQKTTENIHVSDWLRRIVTFLIIVPYKYPYLLTYLLRQGGVTWSSVLVCLSVCMYVCDSVSRITHEHVYGCRPNMVGTDKGWPLEVIKFWCWYGCGSSISFSLSLTLGDVHLIRYMLTHQRATLQHIMLCRWSNSNSVYYRHSR